MEIQSAAKALVLLDLAQRPDRDVAHHSKFVLGHASDIVTQTFNGVAERYRSFSKGRLDRQKDFALFFDGKHFLSLKA